jgi:hypothetical protein
MNTLSPHWGSKCIGWATRGNLNCGSSYNCFHPLTRYILWPWKGQFSCSKFILARTMFYHLSPFRVSGVTIFLVDCLRKSTECLSTQSLSQRPAKKRWWWRGDPHKHCAAGHDESEDGRHRSVVCPRYEGRLWSRHEKIKACFHRLHSILFTYLRLWSLFSSVKRNQMSRKSKVSPFTSQSGQESIHNMDAEDNTGRFMSCSQYVLIVILHTSHLQKETAFSSEALVYT